MNVLLSILIVCSTFLTHAAVGADGPSALELIGKAYALPRADDQVATVKFTFSEPGTTDRQVVYVMAWKNLRGKDGYDSKAMFFTDAPIERNGVAYLGWLRTPGSESSDDERIYLPELRMTRRTAHRDHAHAHDNDEFGPSLLTRENLELRAPELDDHVIARREELDGRTYVVVASTPKAQKHGATSKIERWIDPQTHLVHRARFYDRENSATLDTQVEWVEVSGLWIWRSITATDPRRHVTTSMEIDNIRINTGLRDSEFSKRTLEKRPSKFH